NQFSGSIPRSLSKNSKLNLSVAGNPLLCTNDKSCPGSGVLVIRHRRKTSVPPNSGNTSHRANVTSSGARGIKQFDVSDEDRFYSSPAPLLVGVKLLGYYYPVNLVNVGLCGSWTSNIQLEMCEPIGSTNVKHIECV
ncbi:hypothetical protein Tco_0478395, partial [Tanacetum coccineum]